ncbi:hypothetical protein JMJ35_010611 [Cladonia borealis]|uniref:Uncharacterized protein n=1 Tax=Cladonia borealis TaxID=184061 RepID=A0AA39QR64_9LECA|nr:hypothetical protein JMJ35_010611 [Cladonia borealis]
MGTIITGHLAIEEAGMGLRQGMERLNDVPSDIVEVDELLKSLGRVTDIVSDLAPQLDAFSYMFCMEKDRMTHTFRTFVETYAMTITSSGYEKLTLPSIFLFPGFHLMRIIGQHFLWSWLPEPKLYSIQVRAEIQYRKAQLIYELEAALERIDASSPATQLIHNSSSHSRHLETAIDQVTIYQQSIRQMMDGSDSPLWQWIRKSEATARLERYRKLGQHVRGRLLAVRFEYGVYRSRLRRLPEFFSQTFDSFHLARLLARSSLAVPEPLFAHVRKISFLLPGQSSRADKDGDSRDITHIFTRSRASLYDLDSVDDTRLSSLRSEVAQICNAGNYIMMGSDDLFSICTIYHLGVVRSVLDNDLLSDYPTSWAVVREKAIHRWEQRMRT